MTARDLANYFLSLDPDRQYFNQKLINRNGSTFYEGNARLNKYMHLAQNIYIAMTGNLLIDSPFYAYNNGAVIPDIQRDYRVLLNSRNEYSGISSEQMLLLRKIFEALKNADIDEIIEIDHEDKAWIDKHNGETMAEQKMDSLQYKEIYEKQYADMIKVLNRMKIA